MGLSLCSLTSLTAAMTLVLVRKGQLAKNRPLPVELAPLVGDSHAESAVVARRRGRSHAPAKDGAECVGGSRSGTEYHVGERPQ